VGTVEFLYLTLGYLFVAFPSPRDPLPDPQFELALITAVAVAYGLVLALLSGWRGHRRWPWLLAGFAPAAILGLVGAAMCTLVFAIWLFARMRVRDLTPDEIEAVEQGPGAIGQSWYVHGRGYWLYRLFVISGLGFMLLVAGCVALALIVGLADPPAHGSLQLPENSLVEQLSRRWFVTTILLTLNFWSGWFAWRRHCDKLQKAAEAPLDIPEWAWRRQERLSGGGISGRLESGFNSYIGDESYFSFQVVRRIRMLGYPVILVLFIISPAIVGYLAESVCLNVRRQLPMEPVWRERTEARLKALAEPQPEVGPQLDSAWVRRHGRPGVAARRGRRERSAGGKTVA